MAYMNRMDKLTSADRITVRRIAEELCRERDLPLTRGILTEAVNLWFQGYRPELPRAS